ncbi:hypothetical protein CFAM422_007943 [Trichoderma lentiforme]|uniref:Uncharacterized protein n=1 Tax=Trichoderma lentiforme TaxID=1567552 RepID=A0A9P4XBU5_9HYPO|nr:hypothetical protein CFAM422_007943 [Trichoderma lentiforme]
MSDTGALSLSPGRGFIRDFFNQRSTEARHVEREVEDVVEDDETEVDGCIHFQFLSTLRVTRNDGIVVKIRQLILMKVSPHQNVFGRLYLQEMHTTTLLVETYPEGDEIGEPMEEEDM